MDLRDQLKNLFPEHEEQDFEMPEEKFVQKEPLICKYEKKVYFATKYARFMKNQQKNKYKNIKINLILKKVNLCFGNYERRRFGLGGWYRFFLS